MTELVEKFLTEEATTNPSGGNSFFSFVVSPEYITSEILLSVLYRQLGFTDFASTGADKYIPFLSRDLKKVITGSNEFAVAPFSADEIRQLLEEIVTVPKEATQRDKYKELLFLYPLTPYAAIFSHPIRLKSPKGSPEDQTGGTPWNPSAILKQMFVYATQEQDDLTTLWDEVFSNLSIQDGENEDFFAKCFDGVLETYAENKADTYCKSIKWEKIPSPFKSLENLELMPLADRNEIVKSPHKVFAEDIRNLLKLKKHFSRRQWLTLFEAYLRLSMSSFVAWITHMYLQVYNVLQSVIETNADVPTIEQFRKMLSFSSNTEHSIFSYGEQFAKNKRELVVKYGPAFYYIAFLLFTLKEKFSYVPNWTSTQNFLDSLKDISSFFQNENTSQEFVSDFAHILERNSAVLKQKRNGRIKHLDQFFANMRQRNVADSNFGRYDQSYMAKKRSGYKSAPYVVIPGSALLLTLAFCCTKRSRTVITLKSFREYLLNFGFVIKQSQIAAFTTQLRNLGLTMDSPDAEEGVIILSPFMTEGTDK